MEHMSNGFCNSLSGGSPGVLFPSSTVQESHHGYEWLQQPGLEPPVCRHTYAGRCRYTHTQESGDLTLSLLSQQSCEAGVSCHVELWPTQQHSVG